MSVEIRHEQQQRKYVVARGGFKDLAQWVFDAVENEGAELQDFRPANEGGFYIAQMYYPITAI